MDNILNLLRSGNFWQGFFRGLSSPAYLFGYKEPRPARTHTGGIESDWAKIGGDMRRVMQRYGETHPI